MLMAETIQTQEYLKEQDFYTQIYGRVYYQDRLRRREIITFDPKHISLKENVRLNQIIQFPPAPPINVKNPES